jgi:hypothetical protein
MTLNGIRMRVVVVVCLSVLAQDKYTVRVPGGLAFSEFRGYEAWREWLRALDKIESLHPKAVVAGHGVLDPDSSPLHIEETRRYLRDFAASLASTTNAIELYETMLSLHPDRVNPGSLWAAAKASKLA